MPGDLLIGGMGTVRWPGGLDDDAFMGDRLVVLAIVPIVRYPGQGVDLHLTQSVPMITHHIAQETRLKPCNELVRCLLPLTPDNERGASIQLPNFTSSFTYSLTVSNKPHSPLDKKKKKREKENKAC